MSTNNLSNLNLPTPSIEKKNLSKALLKKINQKIKHCNGILPFVEYMEQALYEPNLGYYHTPFPILGKNGDFITAPMISSLFSECLSQQCFDIFSYLNLENNTVLEFGAGTGQMALDIIQAFNTHKVQLEQYFILELSPALKVQQKITLSQLPSNLYKKITWLNKLPECFSGVILANEVLDAMPVHRVSITQKTIQQWGVSILDKKLSLQLMPIECEHLRTQANRIQHHLNQQAVLDNQPYSTEINLNLNGFFAALSNFLNTGVILVIDYGFGFSEYYHPERFMGTLNCHYQHHSIDNPLYLTGLMDLTAHVDFSAVAHHAIEHKFSLLGFTSQANFLMKNNLLKKITDPEPKPSNLLKMQQFQQGVFKLTAESEMGALYKVMALGKNHDLSLDTFEQSSLIYQL